MKNSNLHRSSLPLSHVGNFTKHAVENFEENIVNKHNYLEEVKNGSQTKK